MNIFGDNEIKKKLTFIECLKIFIFIFLLWNHKNDVCLVGNDLKFQFNQARTSNTIFNRLLAQHECNEELGELHIRGKLVNYGMSPKNTNVEYVISTYGNLKKRKPINLYDYKRGYKHRYYKKKGLAKLDCYYEKKIFDSLDEIYELSRKMKNDKKAFKKKIYNKFGYRYIFFSLYPLLGIIFYIVFNENGPFSNYCFRDCQSKHDVSAETIEKAHENKGLKMFSFDSTVWKTIRALHGLIFFTFIAIFIFWSVYTLIKIIKYERLKEGKGKMNRKEYINFCEEVFNLK